MKICEYLLGKNYDDERTKCWLITALTKLHSNFKSLKVDFVEKIIEKYSRDKNVEIQQRCLEYYRLIKSETNITKNQFTTTQDEIDIDISLSFLDNYVNSMVKDTGKVYDRKKYDQEKLGIFDTQKEINYKPYQAPVTSIYKEASKEKEKYESRLYANNNYNVNKTSLSNELKVDVPKVWRPDEGYVGKKEDKPHLNTEINISSLSSSQSVVTSSSTSTGVSKNPYAQVVGPKINTGTTDFIPSNKDFNPKTAKKTEVYDPKKGEKEQLKNVLFAGLETKKNPITQGDVKQNIPTKTPVVETKNKQVDLLGLSTNETKPINSQPPKTNTTPSTVNWADLDTVFSMGETQKTSTQPVVSTGSNLLDFELNLNAQTQNVASNKVSSFNNILNKNVKKGLTKSDILPLKIDTEQFGDYWNDCPNDQKQISITTKGINNPSKYFAVLQENGNFSPIEIINNEAIAAGIIKNTKVLLHAEISSNGAISVLIKSFDANLIDDISILLISILK
jgi:hypothetical protein